MGLVSILGSELMGILGTVGGAERIKHYFKKLFESNTEQEIIINLL